MLISRSNDDPRLYVGDAGAGEFAGGDEAERAIRAAEGADSKSSNFVLGGRDSNLLGAPCTVEFKYRSSSSAVSCGSVLRLRESCCAFHILSISDRYTTCCSATLYL